MALFVYVTMPRPKMHARTPGNEQNTVLGFGVRQDNTNVLNKYQRDYDYFLSEPK
jgi:hypothetical protein